MLGGWAAMNGEYTAAMLAFVNATLIQLAAKPSVTILQQAPMTPEAMNKIMADLDAKADAFKKAQAAKPKGDNGEV